MKKGDIVEVIDASWNLKIGKDGKLENSGGELVGCGNFEVIAANCKLPSYNYISDLPDKSNDVIIRSTTSGAVYFTSERFLKLIHRCECCPNCGKEI